MPRRTRYVPLQPVAPSRLSSVTDLPRVREYKTDFPKGKVDSKAEARAALKRWQEKQPDPPPVRNPVIPVQAVPVTRASLSKLRAVAESEVAPSEMLEQRMTPEQLVGILYSANSTYEFMKLQAEYKRRKSSGRALGSVEEQWKQIVSAARTAYAAAGRPNVSEGDLNKFVRELAASRANLDTVIRLANTAVVVEGDGRLSTGTRLAASFTADVAKVVDLSDLVTPILDLCSDPIAQGSFTKHFARSLSFSVTIKYWCPTWTNPFRTCTKTVTLAGVSFSIGLTVGYKVNCCGATAWGQTYAEVCATIIGVKVCAGCTATVTGVAGISRTPVASGCIYGLGINATLQCKLGGHVILSVVYPFGWTVTGPCPPAGLCK